jgi:hypothetical protein
MRAGQDVNTDPVGSLTCWFLPLDTMTQVRRAVFAIALTSVEQAPFASRGDLELAVLGLERLPQRLLTSSLQRRRGSGCVCSDLGVF